MAIHDYEIGNNDIILNDGRLASPEYACYINAMQEICDNLKTLRKTLNLTQEKLAVLLGVSRQTIIKYEYCDFYEDGCMEECFFIALMAVFSLRPKSALYLKSIGFYENPVVNSYGFTGELCDFICKTI
jgi:hypothetical protein